MEDKAIKELLRDYIYGKTMFFAMLKHGSQKRIEGTPYIYHPVRTFLTLSKIYTNICQKNEDLLKSALLHDTLEDTKTTKEELAIVFTDNISQIVAELTIPKGTTHKEKGIILSETMPKMQEESLSIKLADRLDNISTLSPLSQNRKNRYLRESRKILYNLEHSNRELTEEQNYLLYNLYNKIDEYNPPIYIFKDKKEDTQKEDLSK